MNIHGPSAAVAFSCPPFVLAVCAACSSADVGKPSTSDASTHVCANALVASRTLLENLVLSSLSSLAISLYRSFWAPSRATPLSWASRTSHSTALLCASVSDVHADSFFVRATRASYTGRD